jgi:hypothetical protein
MTNAMVTENEPQRSQCVGRVPRLKATGATKSCQRVAGVPPVVATGAPRRNESLRGFLRRAFVMPTPQVVIEYFFFVSP